MRLQRYITRLTQLTGYSNLINNSVNLNFCCNMLVARAEPGISSTNHRLNLTVSKLAMPSHQHHWSGVQMRQPIRILLPTTYITLQGLACPAWQCTMLYSTNCPTFVPQKWQWIQCTSVATKCQGCSESKVGSYPVSRIKQFLKVSEWLTDWVKMRD